MSDVIDFLKIFTPLNHKLNLPCFVLAGGMEWLFGCNSCIAVMDFINLYEKISKNGRGFPLW